MSNAFIKIDTLEYPRHEGDIRREHPEIKEEQTGDSFPIPQGWARVSWTEPPAYDSESQACYEQSPVLDGDVWRMTWAVRELTAEEIAQRKAFDPRFGYRGL